MEKHCEMCGCIITAIDGRRKYCDSCRKVRKSFQNADAAKHYRQIARQKRKDEHLQIVRMQKENEILRAEIVRLREIWR